MRTLVFLCLISFGMVFPLQAQPIDDNCTQNTPSACVDWERGVVIADGIGAPSSKATNPALKNASALRAARLDAARNILEMIKGINISASTTMQDAMIADDTVKTHVQGYLHGLRPVGNPKYFSDGTIKVRMEARLRQTIPAKLLEQERQEAPQPVSGPTELKGSVENSKIDVTRVYTGLVIDARGTQVKPAMSPKVVDEEGNVVYGVTYVDREFVVSTGMAGYVKDLEKAKASDRVKGSPLVVAALKRSGKNGTDLVISNDTAAALRQIGKNQSLLKEARVMIVLD